MSPDFARTFFITSVTWGRRAIFAVDRNACLFIETMLGYRDQGKFLLHEFVVMPDHFHLMLTPRQTLSLERVLQFIKGGYSFRYRKETSSASEVWERSFTNHRIRDVEDYDAHRRYIHMNPVRKKLVSAAHEYPYSSARPGFVLDPLPQRLKPLDRTA